MTDGCTGFWLFQAMFPAVGECCAAHDAGASNGVLLDCLQANLPPWAYVVAAFCVAVMVLFRPLYRLIFRHRPGA